MTEKNRHLEPGSRVVGGVVLGPDGKLRGRAKGAVPKAEKLLREAQRQIEEKFGIVNFDPVVTLMMIGADDSNEASVRISALGKAAPFVRATLKSVELTGEGGGPVQTADVSEIMAEAAKLAKVPLNSLLNGGIGDEVSEDDEDDEELEMTPEREAAIEAARAAQAVKVADAADARKTAAAIKRNPRGAPEALAQDEELLGAVPKV